MTDKEKLMKLVQILKTDRFVILDLSTKHAHTSIEIEEILSLVEKEE
tara:strand:+ start:278 stop:418 length:141 start_codon:yes stop_codon:yes gene_type:complete